LEVALGVPADKQDRPVERQVRAFGQGDELCGHGAILNKR
jgi:hypothetical protein